MTRKFSGLILMTAAVFPAVAYASFSDVPPRHPNLDAIAYVQAQGMVSGYADGTYKPDQVINRAEFTKIIIEAIATKDELQNCSLNNLTRYGDVVSTDWYARYVCVGTERGILQGHLVSNGKAEFRPAENINFVAAAKILTVAFGIGEPPLDCTVENGELCTQAAARGDIWYKRHVVALEERHAIPVSITSFQHGVTRGEMAEMIYRLHAEISEKESSSYEQLEHPAKPSALIPSEWDTYTNNVAGYSVRYSPKLGGMGSNTFGILEPSCAVDGNLGPLAISLRARSEATSDSYFESNGEQKLLPAEQRIEVVRQLNLSDHENFPNKQTADSIEIMSINGKTAYRFWTTESVQDLGGGYVAKGKNYLVYFDDGDLMYQMSYAAQNEGEVSLMLSTWADAPIRFTGNTLFDAANKCQQAQQ